MTQSADSVCVHHWLIAEPNGATSTGVCKRCSARKTFFNSIETKVWTTEGSKRGSANSFGRKG